MDGGSIVLISSALNKYSGVGADFLLYCTCKGAIEQMTRVLSRTRRINAVAPGPVDNEHFRRGKSAEQIASMHLAQPEEIARVVLFLCGEQSGAINGQVLYADGGMS